MQYLRAIVPDEMAAARRKRKTRRRQRERFRRRAEVCRVRALVPPQSTPPILLDSRPSLGTPSQSQCRPVWARGICSATLQGGMLISSTRSKSIPRSKSAGPKPDATKAKDTSAQIRSASTEARLTLSPIPIRWCRKIRKRLLLWRIATPFRRNHNEEDFAACVRPRLFQLH